MDVTVQLGNVAAVAIPRDPDTGELREPVLYHGDGHSSERVTTVILRGVHEDRTVTEVMSEVGSLWANHSQAKPSWVAASDPTVATVLGASLGVEVRPLVADQDQEAAQ